MQRKSNWRVVWAMLLALSVVLAGCGQENYQTYPATMPVSAQVLHDLAYWLNEGNVAAAVEVFEDDAILIESYPKLPNYYTGTFGHQVIYKDKANIEFYLRDLVLNDFQSSENVYQEDGDTQTWQCRATLKDIDELKIEFRAVIEAGKIKALTASIDILSVNPKNGRPTL